MSLLIIDQCGGARGTPHIPEQVEVMCLLHIRLRASSIYAVLHSQRTNFGHRGSKHCLTNLRTLRLPGLIFPPLLLPLRQKPDATEGREVGHPCTPIGT